MKNLLSLLLCFSVIMGCTQENTYQDYKEILRKDPDFVAHINALHKEASNASHHYYGNLTEINVWMDANPMDLKGIDVSTFRTAYLVYCEKAGMFHADEAYDLRQEIAQTLNNLRNKHKFLKTMPIAEVNALFNETEKTYPEFKLDPMGFISNPKKQ